MDIPFKNITITDLFVLQIAPQILEKDDVL